MSSARDKMLNYEAVPPQGTWDKIAAALDESRLGDQFPARLHSMEVTPPSMAWEKIAASLEEEEVKPETKLVRQPRIPAFLRYAAAAAVIGAVAFGILRWTGNTDKNTTGTAAANVQSDSGRAIVSTPPADTPKTINTESDTDALALEQSKNLIAKLDRPVRNQSRKSNPVYPAANKVSSTIYTYNDHVPSMADRYIMLMTPDGNLIRMSKKWGSLVCCVSGEDPDADCKDQLKKWQEKMATSSLTTSAGNFMDIISLVSSLEEGSDL